MWNGALAGLAGLGLVPSLLAAQIRVTPFTAAPLIDGVLDEPVWADAARLDGFVQTQPGDNIAPSTPTTVWIGFDAHMLYLGIRAVDDSALVRATLAARDDILDDDVVAIYLDTFGDRRRAYVLAFNPLGIQQDGLYTEGAAAPDYSVDVVMQSRGRLDRHGWTVEVAVPLSSLHYAVARGLLWNVQVQRRVKHRNDEQDSWRPLQRGASGFLTQAGSLAGFDALPARRAADLYPSLTAVSEGARVAGSGPGSPPPDGWQDQRPRTELGLTARFGLTPDVTADLAVNPDFAQVEADAPVVTANQRYPIFFEEKRPFFLEGIEIFRTPRSVVHTRSIVDPDAAIKLTGKRGAMAFGILAARDAAPVAHDVGVLRLRREFGRSSTIGLLGTGYWSPGRDNATAGVDLRVAAQQLVTTLQVTGTWSRRPYADPDAGHDSLRFGRGVGYALGLARTARHFNVTLSGNGASPDYATETGYTPRVNINSWSFETRWNSEPRSGAFLVSWSAAHTVHYEFDWSGRGVYGFLWPRVALSLPRLTTVTVGPYADYQRLFEAEFGRRRGATQAGAFAGPGERRTVYHGFAVTLTSSPDRRWTVASSLDWSWNAFDYDFGAGPRFPRVSPAALANPSAPLDPGPGATQDQSVSLRWRPTTALRLGADYTRSWLRRNDTHLVAFNENLWSAQVVYQLGRSASVRLRGDYRSSTANVRPQILLAWTPGPGKACYAGYNDDLELDGYSPVTGAPERGLHRNARTVFVKLSYLLRWTGR